MFAGFFFFYIYYENFKIVHSVESCDRMTVNHKIYILLEYVANINSSLPYISYVGKFFIMEE